MNLKRKNVVVTGASSGIGLEIVRLLLKEDCRVIAVARSIEKINFNNENVIKYACDISHPENIDKLFDFVGKTFDKLDLFMCNAGFAYFGEIKKPDWAEIEKIFRTNVFSSIYVAEKMKAKSGDAPFRIAITASAMSFLSYPGYALYSSTKAALHGFITGYRSELTKGQKLHMIYPIGTRTKFFDTAGSNTPVPWPTQTPEQVAAAAIKGIIKDKDSIFPSKLFLGLHILNGYLPIVYKLIITVENLKFRRWLKSV